MQEMPSDDVNSASRQSAVADTKSDEVKELQEQVQKTEEHEKKMMLAKLQFNKKMEQKAREEIRERMQQTMGFLSKDLQMKPPRVHAGYRDAIREAKLVWKEHREMLMCDLYASELPRPPRFHRHPERRRVSETLEHRRG
eukprot:s143_g44.t1